MISTDVILAMTFWTTTSDGIRFRNEARFTIANGIANIVDSANGSRSTGGRDTRIGRSTGSAFYKNMNRGKRSTLRFLRKKIKRLRDFQFHFFAVKLKLTQVEVL